MEEKLTDDEISYLKQLGQEVEHSPQKYAFNRYVGFLTNKYKLANEDRIEDNGSIVRKQCPEQ